MSDPKTQAREAEAFKTMAIPEEPDEPQDFKTMAIPEEPGDEAEAERQQVFGKE